jgi:hypothetical protein
MIRSGSSQSEPRAGLEPPGARSGGGSNGPFCNRLIGDRRGDLSAVDGAKGAGIFDCRDKDAGIALIFSIKLATSGGDHRRLGQSSSPQR